MGCGMRGFPVRVEFSSADASTAAAVSIYNADMVAVTLAANQRLVIRSGVLSTATAAGLTTLFSDANSGGTVNAGERLLEITDGIARMDGKEEGIPCKVGLLPKIKAAAAGQVSFSGEGFLENATTEGARPAYRESMVPGV